MVAEAHYPSKLSVVLVFTVILLMMGGVFAWAFYFNKGNVIVNADRGFELEVNNKIHDCKNSSCEVSLSPASYDFVVKAEGYYDETFSVDVERWQAYEKNLQLTLIPFLKDLSEDDIPPVVEGNAIFKKAADGKLQLHYDDDGEERFIASFETLKDPKVQVAGGIAIVVDSGRIFFVNLEDGRKLRRFDDTITIIDAFMSDNGKKILLFVAMEEVDQIWLWINETNELMPLTWYEPPELVKWENGVDHRIYVISDQLKEEDEDSFFGDLIESVDESEPVSSLFKYNLDTGTAQKIEEFEERVPVELMLRTGRYFLKYVGGVYQEVVVK